jgi:hypothetical protein
MRNSRTALRGEPVVVNIYAKVLFVGEPFKR